MPSRKHSISMYMTWEAQKCPEKYRYSQESTGIFREVDV